MIFGMTSASPVSYTDWQFGKTKFNFIHAPDDGVSANHQLCDRTVEPRWMTRSWADPASPAGISGSLSGTGGGTLNAMVFAVLDVPDVPDECLSNCVSGGPCPTTACDASLCVGRYSWDIRNELHPSVTERPLGSEGDVFRQQAISPPAGLGKFTIIAAATDGLDPILNRNPLEGYVGWYTQPFETDMKQLIPYHKFSVNIGDNWAGARPAAVDLVVEFPKNEITIKTVFEEFQLGRGSVVRWCVAGTGTCPPDTNSQDTVGELHVHFADPDARTFQLSVAFDKTLSQAVLYGPLWQEDIQTGKLAIRAGARAYDANGADISSAYQEWISGIW